MKFIPKFDMVLVRIAKEKDITDGGIVIPDSAKNKPDEGIILAVGPTVTDSKVGDKVVFGKYVGVYLSLKGLEGSLLIHETDILGTIKEK